MQCTIERPGQCLSHWSTSTFTITTATPPSTSILLQNPRWSRVKQTPSILICLIWKYFTWWWWSEIPGEPLADCLEATLALANSAQPGAHVSAWSCHILVLVLGNDVAKGLPCPLSWRLPPIFCSDWHLADHFGNHTVQFSVGAKLMKVKRRALQLLFCPFLRPDSKCVN